MKLSDLTKNVATMSEEELLAHVRGIRNNKYVAKPAVAKRTADVEKKGIRKTIRSKTSNMTDQEKLAIVLQLRKDLENV